MAEIELEVGLKGFKEAQSSVTGIESRITKLVKKFEAGAVSQDNYTRALLETKRAYTELGVSSQKASSQVEKYVRNLKSEKAAQEAAKVAKQQAIVEQRKLKEEQRESARAQKESIATTQREAKELERLRQSYDPLYRASQLYAKQEAELQALMNSGVGSTQRYQQALDQLNKEYQDFGNGVGTATNRFASSALGAQRGMNGLGMAMQQTGYQVGDFLVQVQGGTNPMVAFGQQATQLVGVLYLLPPALLNSTVGIRGLQVSVTALIASLGIIIPLATAVGAALMRTSTAGKTFEETLTELETAVSDYKSAMTEASAETTELNTRFGSVSSSIRPFLQDLRELEKISALNALSEQFSKLEVTSGSFFQRLGSNLAQDEGAIALQKELSEELGITAVKYTELKESVASLQQAETVSGRLEQAIALRNLVIDTTGGVENMTGSMREFYARLVDVVIAGGDLNGAISDTGASTASVSSTMGTLAAQTEMFLDGLREGYEEARAKAEAHVNLVRDLEEELGEAGVTALVLAGVDLESGVDAAAKAAALLVTNLGLAYGEAVKIVALGGTRPKARPNDIDFGVPERPDTGVRPQGRPLDFMAPPATKGRGGSKKSGGSSRESSLESFIKSLQTEQEALNSWYTEQQDLLAEFNEKELEALGGHNEAKLRLDQEYAERKKAIEKSTYETVVNAQQAAMGALQGFMGTLAGQSETAAKAVLAINTAMSISQAIQNTAVAATRALAELGPVAGPPAAAKIKAYGNAQVGLIAANAALKLGASGSGGGGGGGVSSNNSAIATPTAQEQQGPQEVILRGLKPGMRLSPEELQEVFDQIYDENDRRGTIFRVDLS